MHTTNVKIVTGPKTDIMYLLQEPYRNAVVGIDGFGTLEVALCNC